MRPLTGGSGMATTLLEHALLGLLATEPASGYDLRRLLRITSTRRFSASPGSVYPALARLEARGLVRSMPDARGGARRRRQYRPTDEGLRDLCAWVRLPVSRAEVAGDIAVPLLRFGFADLCMTREEAIAFLEHFRDELSAHVDELRSLADSVPPARHPHRLLVLRHAVETRAASLRWVGDAIHRLDAGAPEVGT